MMLKNLDEKAYLEASSALVEEAGSAEKMKRKKANRQALWCLVLDIIGSIFGAEHRQN